MARQSLSMSEYELEEYIDLLETFMAATKLHPRTQSASSLWWNINKANPVEPLHPESEKIRVRLTALTEDEIRTVRHQSWNPMRKWNRVTH